MADIQFGLGNLLNDLFQDALDIELPPPVIIQLNSKAGINKNDEFVFDHEGFSGRLGDLEGEMKWPGGESTYKNTVSNDGLIGSHSYTSAGELGEFAKDLFDAYNWDTYDQEGRISWDIDPMNMKAEFGWFNEENGVSTKGNQATLVMDAKLGIQVEATEESFSLVFSPTFKYTGLDAARQSAPEMVTFTDSSDIDYDGNLEFEVPSVSDCQNYFDQKLNKDAQCQLNIKSSDLPMQITLKMKHKFAFIKAGPMMAYVKSEGRDGSMVGFDEMMYLSFYVTQQTNQGKPFATIKRRFDTVGNDLLLTIPLIGAFENEIIPAAMQYGAKWMPFFGNLFGDAPTSIVKAIYWMDKWVPSVQDSTFDISEIVAATRLGCGEYPNSQFQENAVEFGQMMSSAMKNHQFEMLEIARDFVEAIHGAEKESEQKFALPA